MSVLCRHVQRRRQQFQEQWPGMRSFWPGLPIGIVLGLTLLLGLRMVWPEPVAFAAGLFVMFAAFLSIGLFREVPGAREFPGTGVLVVLGASALGVALGLATGYVADVLLRLLR